ncbi:MAG: DUF1624 domain-containing protein [Verrucomicrobia bacterium]|nr:DUF1624 domain-containing protein [Verrucomicrobiota bacterium]
MSQSLANESSPSKPPSGRLLSLDALRGFDMFWIVGAENIVEALHGVNQSGPVNLLASQLQHKAWEGVAFYDLIFPLFVFIVGVSLVFSLSKTIEQHGRATAYRRVVTRGVIMLLLGIFYYGGFAGGWEKVRLMGVLQRIAICYLAAGIIFCTFKLRGLIACCVALLVGYWALMALVPIRDINLETKNMQRLSAQTGINDPRKLFNSTTTFVTGSFEEGRNLANHIDFQYLPFRKWDGHYDPEGLLSNLPAIGTCLLGVFAGLLLKSGNFSDQKKVAWLVGAGAACVLLGFFWGVKFPVIKKIWSSSYVLVAGGYASLFLGVFYQIIDVWKFQRWATPFVWIGVNPLTIYLAHNFVEFKDLATRLAGGPVKVFFGSAGELVITLIVMAMTFLLARFLYQRKIFLRL